VNNSLKKITTKSSTTTKCKQSLHYSCILLQISNSTTTCKNSLRDLQDWHRSIHRDHPKARIWRYRLGGWLGLWRRWLINCHRILWKFWWLLLLDRWKLILLIRRSWLRSKISSRNSIFMDLRPRKSFKLPSWY